MIWYLTFACSCLCNSITNYGEIFYLPYSASLITRWLKVQKELDIYVEPRVRAELLTESSDFNFVHTWKDGEH